MAPATGEPPPIFRRVAIVGGGFSGTLQAINLLRNQGPDAVLIERRPQIGRGVAYSAADPALLLNVRASNMSALPDQPHHFEDWLARRGLDAGGFVPRTLYGEYLDQLLHTTRESAPDRLRILQGEAVGVRVTDRIIAVSLADGSTIEADALVLAMGNLPPVVPDGLDPQTMPDGAYAPDPWQDDIAEGLGDDDNVLILGTGLTMVDAILLLENSGFRGRIIALSRRGLLPRAHHGGGTIREALSERPPIDVTGLVREVRQRAKDVGWRYAVDELRPYTRNIWLAANDEQKARFLRHLRPWWEVHRHRIAPSVAERLRLMRDKGRLRIVAGKTTGFIPEGEKCVEVRWRQRGGGKVERLRVRRIINCTGPGIDAARTREPLLQQLRDSGLILPDRWGLGLAVDRHARLIGASGTPSPRLFALGPMTRGTFWEITAVPDIRHQTWELARRLSNMHWVAAEGL